MEKPKIREKEVIKIGDIFSEIPRRKAIVESINGTELKKGDDIVFPDIYVIYKEDGHRYIKTGANWNEKGYWEFTVSDPSGSYVKDRSFPELD